MRSSHSSMTDSERTENDVDATVEGGTLVLFGGALGDFLCLWPGLTGLRKQTTGRIKLVAQPAFLELIDRCGFDTCSIDQRDVADLFSTASLLDSTRALFSGFATVHSWMGHGDDNFTARLGVVSGGSVQIHRLRGMAADEHASTYFARCLGVQPTTVPLDPPLDAKRWAAELWSRNALGDATLVIHPGSGSRSKNWQGMQSIAQRWRAERRGRVLLLCGPAEENVDVVHDVLLREPSLNRVAALLQSGAIYLGNDSGVSHLAGLAGARGVVTFGPSNPAIWRPLGGGLRVCHAQTPCNSCLPTVFCTHRLNVDDVWEHLPQPSRKPDSGGIDASQASRSGDKKKRRAKGDPLSSHMLSRPIGR